MSLQTYPLCAKCAERQGVESGPFEIVRGKECFVCQGAMEKVGAMADLAARKARLYQFHTFAVGVSVPEGVQEREDELRSTLRLKGSETIKIQAARLVAAQFAARLGKRPDRQRPDLTLLADFGARDVLLTSKPVYYYGRYTKPAGVSQRRAFCEECRGTGCKKCRMTGYELKPSVEGALRAKLEAFSGSRKVTFTWLGSEDKESRVYPPGRPFVAEVRSPKKRVLPRRFGARLKGGLVSVRSGRCLPSKPVRLPSFKFLTRIRATAATKVDRQGLAELRSRFRQAAVRFDRPHNRPTVKTVYRVSARARGRALFIDAELDGGLPVKRFVSGELVSPSVSEVLKTEVGCRSFDICGVREKGEFEFAEVTRGEEKN